jgi:hypothetical protein
MFTALVLTRGLVICVRSPAVIFTAATSSRILSWSHGAVRQSSRRCSHSSQSTSCCCYHCAGSDRRKR